MSEKIPPTGPSPEERIPAKPETIQACLYYIDSLTQGGVQEPLTNFLVRYFDSADKKLSARAAGGTLKKWLETIAIITPNPQVGNVQLERMRENRMIQGNAYMIYKDGTMKHRAYTYRAPSPEEIAQREKERQKSLEEDALLATMSEEEREDYIEKKYGGDLPSEEELAKSEELSKKEEAMRKAEEESGILIVTEAELQEVIKILREIYKKEGDWKTPPVW